MKQMFGMIGLVVGTFVLGGLALAADTSTGTTVTKDEASTSSVQGGCTLAGSWAQTAEGVGSSIWKIDDAGKATESGLGGATGTATLTGNKLRIDWKISDDLYGYYEWYLDSGCNSGQGELVFQKGYGGSTHKSTVTRQAVARQTAAVSTSVPASDVSSLEPGTDRPGEDYRNFDLSDARPELCRDACAGDASCRAFTYVKPGAQGPKARCWLKSKIPNAVKNDCCVSGVTGERHEGSAVAHPPGPTPKPTPTPSGPEGVSVSKFFNQPEHSPDKLDFGEVWNGQSSNRIFHLTANASGYVRVEIQPDKFSKETFRVAEIRELGPERMVGGKGTGPLPKGPNGPVRDLKGRVKFQAGVPGPYTASADVGNELQVYLVFEPKFDLFQMTAGEKSATMKVSGPGPKGDWALTVPLRGMFNGLIVGAAFTVDDKEVLAVQGTQRVDVAVRLTGTDSVLQGNIHGKNLPPGIQINPVPVTVNPAQTTSLKVPVFLNWGALKADAQELNVGLVFDAGQKSSSAAFSLTPLPASVSASDPKERTDCGIQWLSWVAIFYPAGRLVLNMSGQNIDLANNRNVVGFVNVAGKPVAWGILHLHLGAVASTDAQQWDSSKVNVDFSSRFRADDYLLAVRGPVTLSCQLIDISKFEPPF